MKQGIRYYRDGVEIDEHEALSNGILRDGVTLSVPTSMRDSSSLGPLQRAVAADADRRARVRDAFGGQAGHRPGYALATSDQAAQDAKARAYSAYDSERENAWRSPRQNGGPTFPEDQRSNWSTRDGIVVKDTGPGPRTQRRLETVNANDATRDHSRVMQEVYGAYDHELAQRWRHK
ncbi:hypothetical protein V4R08_05095 [Nitrobacter sp. NHB1]|uniref:hypothetical protein n=1 Tax=Nitrobacter sp. NHB1 TaxID=3119830 RepID=UPI002FFE3561